MVKRSAFVKKKGLCCFFYLKLKKIKEKSPNVENVHETTFEIIPSFQSQTNTLDKPEKASNFFEIIEQFSVARTW